MKKYILTIEGVQSVNTDMNKVINIVKGDIVEIVEDLGDTYLVKFSYNNRYDVLGCFKIKKDILKEI